MSLHYLFIRTPFLQIVSPSRQGPSLYLHYFQFQPWFSNNNKNVNISVIVTAFHQRKVLLVFHSVL